MPSRRHRPSPPAGRPAALGALLTGACALALAVGGPIPIGAAAAGGDSQYFATTAMPNGRQSAGAAVIGNFIYVMGGVERDPARPDEPGNNTRSTIFAPVGADGQIGQWRPTTSLPTPLLYIGNSTVSRGPIIYIAGGNINDGAGTNVSSNVVTMAAQREGGVLSNWIQSDPFPGSGLQAGAAVATRTHLYVIGGADTGNTPQPLVYIAPFAQGGLLGPWAQGPPLPQGLWFHMAGVANGRLYVWGGTTSAQGAPDAVDTTYVADIRPDGSLSAWRTLRPLPQPIYFSGSASLDDTLFNFGGRFRDASYTSDVLFAIPDAQGELNWTLVRASVPVMRYLAPAVDDRLGIIYLPGGRSPDTPSLAQVFGYRVRLEGEVAEAFGPSPTAPPQPVTPSPAPTPPPTRPTVSQPESSPAPTPQPPAPSVGVPPNVPGSWTDYSQGEIQAIRENRNMLLYFTTPQARLNAEVIQNIFSNPGFRDVSSRHVCIWINAAAQRDLAVTYGVYRVPTVVVVSPRDGRVLGTFVRSFSLSDLSSAP
jgi:hypothetical protein